MPELPEVETTARYLNSHLVGAEISKVEIFWKKTIATPSHSQFGKILQGCVFKSVERRGKFIVATLSSAQKQKISSTFLITHLRMSGSFDVLQTQEIADKHERIIFHLKDGRSVRFSDPRKFGKMYLVKDPQEITSKLGPEPLLETFDLALLSSVLEKKKRSIKPLLLDQSQIAGIGNIYADEILWRSMIHPKTKASTIRKDRLTLLLNSIKSVLQEAILKAGTDFGDDVVPGGGYQPNIYGRTGELCSRCQKKIKRIVLGSRSTHFCQHCQR